MREGKSERKIGEALPVENEKRKEEERIEQEETIRGIADYLKEHKEKLAEKKLKKPSEKKRLKKLIKLEENFLKGEVDEELIKMIKETPTLKEEKLESKKKLAEEKYRYSENTYKWAELIKTSPGSEEERYYWNLLGIAEKEYYEYLSMPAKETFKRKDWVEMLEEKKLSHKEIKEILAKKGEEKEEIDL